MRATPGRGGATDLAISVPLTDDDARRLRTSLGSHADLERIAAAPATAGATELLELATGRTVPGSLRDARLFRVFLLLRAGISLAEAQAVVAAVFKETPGRARGLVEATIARYDVELRAPVDARAVEVLDTATWREDRWEVELPTGFVRDRVLALAADTSYADPTRAGRGVVYLFPDETYQAVRSGLGGARRAKPKR